LQDTAYRVLAAGRHSAVLFEGVKYLLSMAPPASAAQAGQTLTFTGTVTPFRAGHPVYLERQNANGGGFHLVEKGTLAPGTNGSGTFTIAHTLFGSGKQVFRIKVPGDPANEGVATAPFTIEVTLPPASALRTRP
jgi:hypothetical protein